MIFFSIENKNIDLKGFALVEGLPGLFKTYFEIPHFRAPLYLLRNVNTIAVIINCMKAGVLVDNLVCSVVKSL